MATTYEVTAVPIPIGDSIFGPFPVASGVQSITLRQIRTGLPDTGSLLAEAKIDVSVDGGANYLFYASTGIIGGTAIGRDGTSDLTSQFSPFPSPSLVKIRVTAFVAFTLTGASVILKP